MEMHQLRYLEAVARHGSIMAASRRCHISQPALSVQLKLLEEELGQRLLLRSSRGVSLTPAGMRALASAGRVLRELATLKHDVRTRSYSKNETIRLGLQPYVATEIMPGILGGILGESPESLRLEFRELPPAKLAEAVLSGETDLGIMDMAGAVPPQLVTRLLCSVPFRLYLHKAHPLARRRTLHLRDLLSHALIFLEGCPGLRGRLLALCQSQERELSVSFSTEMALTAFEMIDVLRGMAVLPESFETRAARRGMVSLPLRDYVEQAKICVLWREEAELSAGALLLIEKLQQGLAKLTV